MSKQIQLTQGKVAIVDDDDYESLVGHKWNASKNGKRYYAQANVSHSEKFLMHRIIMNAPQGMDVDHINGNGLDNRKSNLRVCNRSENMRNRDKNSNNTSGYRGVSFRKDIKKWDARIMHYGKQHIIGCFNTPEQAARAYDEKAKELFGEFARLNFSD